MKIKIIALIAFMQSACGISQTKEIQFIDTNPLIKPTLFADLGESCTTPDGMAVDRKGNLYLSVLNPTSYEKNGAKILKFDENDKPFIWCDKLPLHPVSKRVHPMGMEFGPDGNLYFMDNQFFAGQKNASRLIRVIVKNGNPIDCEVLVEGFYFGEAVRWRNNRVFVTDALAEKDKESSIFSFSLKELNSGKIFLTAMNQTNYLLSSFTLKSTVTEPTIGIDGIAFDSKGNLYAGNFGDGVITKFEFDRKGRLISRKDVFSSDKLQCCDGFYYDKLRNSIFIANYTDNSVHEFNLTKQTISLIWKNENADGADGQLDNPCETIVYKGKLLVVNYDTFLGKKNKELDQFHTISSFNINN